MGIEFTSFEMSLVVSPLGFSPVSVAMNLMRYAKHGLLSRRREGHQYIYCQNERTERAYMYFFKSNPPYVVKPRVAPGEYIPIAIYNDLINRAGSA